MPPASGAGGVLVGVGVTVGVEVADRVEVRVPLAAEVDVAVELGFVAPPPVPPDVGVNVDVTAAWRVPAGVAVAPGTEVPVAVRSGWLLCSASV